MFLLPLKGIISLPATIPPNLYSSASSFYTIEKGHFFVVVVLLNI